MADRFFDAIGASDIRRHLCGTTAWLGASDVSGTPFGIDPEDLRQARTIILWGTNTYLTNRHLWPVIEQARADGAVVAVIDPVRTSTADRADEFLRIRPGSDVALVLAMIDVLDRDGQIDMARVGRVLTDEALDSGIAALVVHNSNPAVIVPDQNRIITGLAREDLFTVVIDQFMTDTARYADLVLPTTTQIEHLDLGIAWGHLHLSLNQPAIAPVGDSLPNTEIFRRLAAAMGLDDPALETDDEALIRELLDSDHSWLEGITYEHLAQHTWARLRVPKGLRPYVDTTPTTDDGRLHLGPSPTRTATSRPTATRTWPIVSRSSC
jgi:anaerobic selenocysteine-containing dehydrogenase